MDEKIKKTDAEWHAELPPEKYAVLREKATEAPFTGKYWNVFEDGTYHCGACGAELFSSSAKYDAGCGWPSFSAKKAGAPIAEHIDTDHGMVRTEVICDRCGSHLGHVFNDGPGPTGQRFCINSVSITLK